MPGSSPEQDNTDIETKVDDVETKTTDVQESPAASSPAEDKSDKGDMLSAVKAALKSQTEKPLASEEPGSKSEADPDKPAEKEGGEAGEESDDLSEEELNRLRPKTRKRIDNLLRDRSERDQRIAALEPKVEQFEKIVSFVEEAGLSKDEVNQGFGVMRDLKRNPERAYATLKPIVDQLAIMVGEALPDDLRQEVQYGRITEAHARELSRARSQSKFSNERLESTERQAAERREREGRLTQVNEASNAVSELERQREKTDPSWKLKQPLVTELMESEVLRRQRKEPGWIPNKTEALEIANLAIKKVEDQFKNLAPKPKAINASPDAGSSRSVSAPKTMLEAAKRGLQAAAG